MMIKKQTINKFFSSSIALSLLCMSVGGGCSIGISRVWTTPFYVEIPSGSQSAPVGYEYSMIMEQALELTEDIPTEINSKNTYQIEEEKNQLPEKDPVNLSERRIEEEDAPDRLNFAFYFDQEDSSQDVSKSFAGKAYQILASRDSSWVNEIYNLRRISPEQMAKRLGMDQTVVMGIDHFKGLPVLDTGTDSSIIPSWNRISIVFRNGDGTPVSSSSNVKEILSMASVYGYVNGWKDYDSFSDYVTKLWKASHSYKYSMSKIYYCEGECQFIRTDYEEEEEEPEEQGINEEKGEDGSKPAGSTAPEGKIIIEDIEETESVSSLMPSEPDDIIQQHLAAPFILDDQISYQETIPSQESSSAQQPESPMEPDDFMKHQSMIKSEDFVLLQGFDNPDDTVIRDNSSGQDAMTEKENSVPQDETSADKPSEPDDMIKKSNFPVPGSAMESENSLIPDDTAEDSSETKDSVWLEKPSEPDEMPETKTDSKEKDSIWMEKPTETDEIAQTKETQKETDSVWLEKPTETDETTQTKDTQKETDSVWLEKPTETDETAQTKDTQKETDSVWLEKPTETDETAQTKDTQKETDSVWLEKPSEPDETIEIEGNLKETDSDQQKKPSEPDDMIKKESFDKLDSGFLNSKVWGKDEMESLEEKSNTGDDGENSENSDEFPRTVKDRLTADGTSKKKGQVCHGHVDLNISATVIGFDGNKNLFMIDPSSGQSAENSDQWSGWEAAYQDYVKTIAGQDWNTEYGLANSIGVYAANPLSGSEVEAYLNLLPDDISPKRQRVVQEALLSVGCIPYYWGGKPSGSGYEANGFGRVVSPDEDGRILRGLDCSGWINWVYWTALGSRLPAESTSGLMGCGRGISKQELQPGDILIRAGSSPHVYLFLAWAENGSMYVIHETTANANNVTINIFDLDLPYYRCLISEE